MLLGGRKSTPPYGQPTEAFFPTQKLLQHLSFVLSLRSGVCDICELPCTRYWEYALLWIKSVRCFLRRMCLSGLQPEVDETNSATHLSCQRMGLIIGRQSFYLVLFLLYFYLLAQEALPCCDYILDGTPGLSDPDWSFYYSKDLRILDTFLFPPRFFGARLSRILRIFALPSPVWHSSFGSSWRLIDRTVYNSTNLPQRGRRSF